MRHFYALWCVVVGFCLSLAAAQADPLALIHARVIDGTGASARADTTLVIDRGDIISIGERPPKNAKIVDLGGKSIIPALISDHSHVGLVDGMTTAARNYTRSTILSALDQYAHYGVLTVNALGLNKSPLFDQLRREQHLGLNSGADLFGADQGITAPGGMPTASMIEGLGDDQIFRPKTVKEARHAVDRMADEGTDLVKIWLDDMHLTNPSQSPLPVLAPPIMQAAIDEAHRRHLRVAVHIHDLDKAYQALLYGADILAHGIRDKSVDQAFITKLKTSGAWYIPTLSRDEATYYFAEHPDRLERPEMRAAVSPLLRQTVSQESWRKSILAEPVVDAARRSLAMNMRNVMTLYREGINIGFGADSGATPFRLPGFAEHRELVLLVQSGLTPVQALNIATEKAATLLGLRDRGVLAPGKRADFLVIDGEPDRTIADIDRISQVWQRGVVVFRPSNR